MFHAFVYRVGSSPRVRGTVCQRFRGVVFIRFIPACAGNRAAPPPPNPKRPVHPRVCGEQAMTFPFPPPWCGSSPRVRGTVLSAVSIGASHRFIPACAGNRQSDARKAFVSAVHPRVCGEQLCSGLFFSSRPGSSPRVRGTDLWRLVVCLVARFIPACAGNSLRSSYLSYRCSVHPRVCGEQAEWYQWCAGQGGSSPRVRGTDAVVGFGLFRRRFIPACAGNS